MMIVLCGWLQWRVEELLWLYNRDEIDVFLNHQSSHQSDKSISLLNDEHYMNTYHVYLYRNTRNELFDKGILKIEPDYLNTNKVTLILDYCSGALNTLKSITYTGHLFYSDKDRSMSMTLYSDNGKVMQLQFYYDQFYTDMYYRQGLVMLKGAQILSPICMKIILTKKPVSKKDMIYIKGLLSLNQDMMIMTPSMLNEFNKDIIEYEWYNLYNDNVYHYIYQLIHEHYILNLNEVYNHFMGVIAKDILYKMILALKSIDLNGYEDHSHFISFVHDHNAHELFK